MNTFFSDKTILWRKMAKIWLKVKENGTKKNRIGENGGERKKILVRTLQMIDVAFTNIMGNASSMLGLSRGTDFGPVMLWSWETFGIV